MTETDMSWSALLTDLLAGSDTAGERARWAMESVMTGEATAAQIAAFLVALRAKGPSGAEVSDFVDVMLQHAVPVTVPGLVVDTCGTGGDQSGSVNISTMAAVVVAATGIPVVKHGNRAASSRSGSADVLEALGVAISLRPDQIAQCLAEVNIAFCFAPVFHPAMRHAGPVRRELGIPTVFNILGPLANPARPAAQVVGVADPSMAPVVARALADRGTSALVVRGEDGMDEITTVAPTRVWDARGGSVTETVIDTRALGIGRADPESLAGGGAAENAELARAALAGRPRSEVLPIRDAVAINAAAAVVVAESARGAAVAPVGLIAELAQALDRVRHALDTGAAEIQLNRWVEVSKSLADGSDGP
ncbi:MAG: anthranilate phosphoribosyltransferase [Candidatus Nanopelagicales bacterium]|nr:anthranilate phosphoribosyltransferase [Candidatus Nanopelagicales bacterium]